MITAYFLIATFAMGWLLGSDNATKDTQWTFWERVATVALCLVWPFLAYVCWKTSKGRRP